MGRGASRYKIEDGKCRVTLSRFKQLPPTNLPGALCGDIIMVLQSETQVTARKTGLVEVSHAVNSG